MKLLIWKLILTSFLLIPPAVAELADAPVSDGTATGENFFFISSADCKTSFYVPRSYTVDQSQTSVLLTKGPSAAASPVIHLTALLNPSPRVPTDADRNQAVTSQCPNMASDFAPYTSVFQTLSMNDALNAIQFPIVDVSVRSDAAKVLRLNIDPTKIDLKSLLLKLKNLQPEERITVYSEKTDASVQLDVGYQAAATFAEKYFNERACTTTDTCHKILGIGSCSQDESCQDVPKMIQVLDGGEYTSGFGFQYWLAPNIPETVLQTLRERLMSRLMMSLYLESARTAVGDVVQIKYGELKRENSNQYHDQASQTRIGEDSLSGPIRISSLEETVAPELTRIYKELERK